MPETPRRRGRGHAGQAGNSELELTQILSRDSDRGMPGDSSSAADSTASPDRARLGTSVQLSQSNGRRCRVTVTAPSRIGSEPTVTGNSGKSPHRRWAPGVKGRDHPAKSKCHCTYNQVH